MEWTGARYADRPTVQVETTIAASPDEVWQLVADPLLMPQLSDELHAVEWEAEPVTVDVGARFVGHNRHPSIGEWSTVSTVVECEPPTRFAWAVGEPEEPAALWRFTLSPDDGGTRLTQSMQMGPARSGLSLAIDAMPDKEQQIVFVRMREHEGHMRQTLAAIKARLEQSR